MFSSHDMEAQDLGSEMFRCCYFLFMIKHIGYMDNKEQH